MKKLILCLFLAALVAPVFTQVPPGPHWVLDKWMYIVKGVMVDSNVYPATNHKRSLGLPTGIDVGPRWWRSIYVDSIFFLSASGPMPPGWGMNRFSIMDSLARYAESGYNDTIQFKCGVLAGQSHFCGGVRNVVLGGRGDTIIDGGMWIDSTRNSAIVAGQHNLLGGISSVISGGDDNFLVGDFSAMSGGRLNSIFFADSDCVIDGGYFNTIAWGNHGSGIFCGDTNVIFNSSNSVILGGSGHMVGLGTVAGKSAIIGGFDDTLDGDGSLIAASEGCYIAGRSWCGAIIGCEYTDLGSAAYDAACIATGSSLNDAYYSAIIGGSFDTLLTNGYSNGIFSSQYSTVCDTNNVVVGGGWHRVGTAGNPGECNAIVGGLGHSMEVVSGWNFFGGGVGDTTAYVMYSGIVGGIGHRMDTASSSFIGGGSLNRIYGTGNGIIGGEWDSIRAEDQFPASYNFIGSGTANYISGAQNGILGGQGDRISKGVCNAISGGYLNAILSPNFTSYDNAISGGFGDTLIDCVESVISGGKTNNITWSEACFIGSGIENYILYGAGDAIVGGIYDTIRPYHPADGSFIGAGFDNYTEALYTGIIAGKKNDILEQSFLSGIFCGDSNVIKNSVGSVILGGDQDTIDGSYFASILGGKGNTIRSLAGTQSAIVGGDSNYIGYRAISGIGNFIAGGDRDSIFDANHSVILGGNQNLILTMNQSAVSNCAIVGSSESHIWGSHNAIIAGRNDTIGGFYSLCFGQENSTSDGLGFLNFLGGYGNRINSSGAKVGSWACGYDSRVDTSYFSFAWNSTIKKADSTFAVCKQLWVMGAAQADTTIITGRVVFTDTLGVHAINWGVDGGSSDDYAVTIPGLQSYYIGMPVYFLANTANTGAATLAINGGAAKALKSNHDLDPPDNYIEAGSIVHAVYDGTNFQIMSPDANP